MLKDQIAADLEKAFSLHGFAEPSVSQLKDACNVSLRTLYKHYPSKEAMIIAALNCRHQRYISLLLNQSSTDGSTRILGTFETLERWMNNDAPNGCMSLNALAAFPENDDIKQAVARHKREVRDLLGQLSQQPQLATHLFLLHEGITSAWPIIAHDAIATAQHIAKKLIEENQ